MVTVWDQVSPTRKEGAQWCVMLSVAGLSEELLGFMEGPEFECIKEDHRGRDDGGKLTERQSRARTGRGSCVPLVQWIWRHCPQFTEKGWV